APITVLGTAAAALAPLWPGAAEIVVQVVGPAVSWLILVARHAASVPGAVIPWPSGGWGGVSAMFVIVLLWCGLRFRGVRLAVTLAVIGTTLFLVPTRVLAPVWPPNGWVLVACDVGQGDGLVLATGERDRAVVVDTGPDPAAFDRCLDRLGVNRIPLVVLTHLHADHVGGLSAVFDGRAVGGVAVGPGLTPEWAWRSVVDLTADRGIPLVRLTAGDRLVWRDLRIDVLAPSVGNAVVGGDTDGTAI